MTTEQPRLSERDTDYVTKEYRTLEQLCDGRPLDPQEVRGHIEAGRLPRATYTLPDGTDMFPPDYFAVLDGAGSVAGMREYFEKRHQAASSALGLTIDPEQDWRGYLTGEFGACLREVTPEAMVEKAALIAEIDRLTAVPNPGDEGWRGELADAVDDLDELERPFTDFDRERWGTVSRDTHVAAVRLRYLSSDATTG